GLAAHILAEEVGLLAKRHPHRVELAIAFQAASRFREVDERERALEMKGLAVARDVDGPRLRIIRRRRDSDRLVRDAHCLELVLDPVLRLRSGRHAGYAAPVLVPGITGPQ